MSYLMGVIALDDRLVMLVSFNDERGTYILEEEEEEEKEEVCFRVMQQRRSGV